ncbi:MAG: response regulator [Planctomycetes bacterium]|nr:response regulator [Planctomycetota bacterium]
MINVNFNDNPKKVLVVDDEVHILHVVSLKLRNAGYDVITAQDGREALEIAQVERPDLIITDYQMPHLSGLELCQRLKRIPATQNIPALMLTARGFAVDPQAMTDAGITMCLHKPFSPREILTVVDQMSGKSIEETDIVLSGA